MTNAQFNILLRDQDITIPGGFVFNETRFDLGEDFYNLLDRAFHWYANLEIREYKKSILTRLRYLIADEKTEFLKELLKTEFLKVDEIIEKDKLEYLEIEDLKNWWYLLIENEHLLSILDYLKFYQLKGEKFPDDWNESFDFTILENYFLSDSLRLAYDAMKIEKRISCLRRLEREMQKSAEALPEENLKSSRSAENVFNKNMPICFATDYFKVFTESKSKNGKPFLLPEQLNNFIERAFFGKKDIQKETINCATREKFFIISRFYDFYLEASKEYENTTQCRRKYIRLLSENFTNWEYDQIAPNFSKKTSKKWPK